MLRRDVERSIVHPMCGMLAASTLASETASTSVNSPDAPKRRIARILIALAGVNLLLVLPLERLRFVLREF